MFTFEWKFIGASWQMSGKRLHTAEEAGKAMANFAVISLENDCVIECRLAKVMPLPSDI